MMLASPPIPAQSIFTTSHASDDSSLQTRPARDREAFLSLLPPPVEFVEGSSSGALAVPPGKYEPINASPRALKQELPPSPRVASSSPSKSIVSTPKVEKSAANSQGIDLSWPSLKRANGLTNVGNTCFLNSALQCLLHTPPLLRKLIAHKSSECRIQNGFCMSCAMRQVMVSAYKSKGPVTPGPVVGKLQAIAKHMRRGRQEDSHEFLRYAIDALQKSCLVGYGPKPDPKIADATWVHGIFGGRLRSRVHCNDCGHNSDTFDRILDLSVDIHNSNSLTEALRKFVAVDVLKGSDKYKCEKCKKHVVARKGFHIHDAPAVLTVHFKRFSPLGKKIGHPISYSDSLSLKEYMSQGQYGPTYDLYGVICHAGGGPHSGHYYAMIKDGEGKWWEMNDESTSPLGNPPLGRKNAYVLFYIRRKGEGLAAAINSTAIKTEPGTGLVSKMKKRKEREEEKEDSEDIGTKVTKPFIGPLLPSPVVKEEEPSPKKVKLNGDPQAAIIKRKIDAAKDALKTLDEYASGSESNDDDKPSSAPSSPAKAPATSSPPSTHSQLPADDDAEQDSSPVKSRSTFSPPFTSSPKMEKKQLNAVPPTNFYGSHKKRNHFDGTGSRSSGYTSPYSRFPKKHHKNRPRAI